MIFLVPNYSCFQNPLIGGYRTQIHFPSVLCLQLNLLNPFPNKIPGYVIATCWPLWNFRTTKLSNLPHKHTKLPVSVCVPHRQRGKYRYSFSDTYFRYLMAMSGQLHVPASLTPCKRPTVPIEWELEISGCGTLLYWGWFVSSDLRLALRRPQMYNSSDTLRSTVLQYADDNVKQALTYLLQALDFLYTEKSTLSLCWYRSLNADGDYANDWWAPCTKNRVLITTLPWGLTETQCL